MPKKKDNKKAERAAKVEKRSKAQKKVAKALKKPASEPKTAATGEVRLSGKEQSTPTGKFKPIEVVPPQIREAYKSRFEEQQLAEIGKEVSTEEQRRRSERLQELPAPTEPKKVKAVRGETAIPAAERPLTPKPGPLEEPTPGQQARRQAGRLPRGTSGTGIFTFQTATRPDTTPGVRAQLDVARQSQKGRDISPLPPHVQATALALARRDHDLAKSTGKTVNNIEPDSKIPDRFSIRGGHHERLAEAIHAYGANEEDFNKIKEKGSFVDKVHFAWNVLDNDRHSKKKTPLFPDSEGATHWENPVTKKVQPTALGGHPEFFRHDADTKALVRGRGESDWTPVKPVRQGWHVVDLRGQKTWTYRSHPAEPYKNTHQVRSLFQHVQNTLKGTFPEAPIRSVTDSVDSRQRAAERVREKFVVMKPEPSEAPLFSRAPKEGGFLREKGRTKKTAVAGLDGVEIKETSQVEYVTGLKRTAPKRPETVQEPSGRRVVRPKQRTEDKKVGYMSQPLTVSQQLSPSAKELERQKKFAQLRQEASGFGGRTVIGPSGEIKRSAPTVQETVKLIPAAKQTSKKVTKLKAVLSKKVTPGLVDQPLPGMESYGYEQRGTKSSRYWKGSLGAGPEESRWKGKWVETPGTSGQPGSARPTPQTESIGETGMEQLRYIKSQYPGGKIPSPSRELVKAPKKQKLPKPEKTAPRTILSGTSPATERNIPQQLEIPGLESPGYDSAVGQQFRAVSEQTRQLQLASKQGAVPGVASEMPRGTEPKKSTRSFKGRR